MPFGFITELVFAGIVYIMCLVCRVHGIVKVSVKVVNKFSSMHGLRYYRVIMSQAI